MTVRVERRARRHGIRALPRNPRPPPPSTRRPSATSTPHRSASTHAEPTAAGRGAYRSVYSPAPLQSSRQPASEPRMPVKLRRLAPAIAAAAVALPTLLGAQSSGSANADWPVYHGTPNNDKYTTLSQITPDNVNQLKVAWTYDTHDGCEGSEM